MLRNYFPRLAGTAAAAFLCAISFAAPGRPDAAQERALADMLAANPAARVFKLGTNISRIYGNIPVGSFEPAGAAQTFIGQYAPVFGVQPYELELLRQTPIDDRFTAFWFAQKSNGLNVEGSGLTVMVKNGLVNAIVLVSPRIRPVPEDPPMGLLSAERARAVVRKDLPNAEYMDPAQLVIWGYDEVGHYAYMVRAGTTSRTKPQQFKYFVDAQSGRILEKRSEVYYTDITGHINAFITPGNLPDTPYNVPTQANLGFARARVIGGNSTFANGSGDFTITNPGSTPVTVEAAYVGQWSTVLNSAGAAEVATVNVTPPGPANLLLNPSPAEFQTAQANAFVHVTAVHNFAKSLNPAYPGIDISIPTYVNVSGTCNAFYSNNTVNFYRSGGGCYNMAFANVMYHEYGHFIIAQGHNNPTGDYHEGVADVNASLFQDDFLIGRDWQGPGTAVRNIDTPNVMYPCSGEAHQCGLVIAGAFWDMLRELRTTMGQTAGMNLARYFYISQVLLSPTIDPGLTIDILTLDDNDGNIGNGTPHYQEIDTGFRAHNLPAPPLQLLGFEIYPTDTEFVPANQPLKWTVKVRNITGSYVPGSLQFHMRINGGAWSIVRVHDLAETVFGAQTVTIPGQPVGTLIEWYASARDAGGSTVNDVDPSTPHQSLAANTVSSILNDNFNSDLGWTVTNDPSLTTGAWQRGVPVTPGAGNEPPSAQGGSGQCYITDNRVGNFDVDGGPTVLSSPTFDMSGANGIVSLYVWMSCSTGEDQLVLQISNNGGSSWSNVKTWNTTSSSWQRYSFVVGSFITPTANMKIRLSVADNPNNSLTEAGLDSVVIRKGS